MALLATQQIGIAGTTPSYVAGSSGGDTVTPADRQFIHCKNTNAATRTVTVVVPGVYMGQALPDVAVVVPATTGDKMIPLDVKMADPVTGLINITYDVNPPTNLTIGVFRS